jgi:small basic protein
VVIGVILFITGTCDRFPNAGGFSLVFAKYNVNCSFGSIGFSFWRHQSLYGGRFRQYHILTGFITNTLLAAGLAYLGDRLGVELYLAAVVVFGVRLFQNLAIIRRYLLKKY